MHGSFSRPSVGLRFLAIPALVLGVTGSHPRPASSQDTRLLRQPTASHQHVAFNYGGDLWVADREGGEARRLTSTPAVETDPHLSPDGRWLAFSSNQSGSPSVYLVSVDGGNPTRLTWHPAPAFARGWTPDGSSILYSSTRETAPVGYGRLWTVPAEGGPSELLPAPMGARGSFSPDARTIAVDRVSRWDEEWRNYRGGQNTPITILDLETLQETRLPNERTTDTQPVWYEGILYFLSDRDFATNVWSWDPASGEVAQVTRFTDADVKALSAGPGMMVIEQDGWIHSLDPSTGDVARIPIHVRGDFPWATARWEDVGRSAGSASLSPTGKRALMAARGEIFTVPAEKGDARNLSRSPGAADRNPIWSPDGETVAWFSDSGAGYRLFLAPQDGLGEVREIDLGESKMGWTPSWSPDGSRIAFVDDRSRIRVLELESGRIQTVDVNGSNWNRSDPTPVWSPDSKWLAYSRTYPNLFRRIVIWSVETGQARPITDALADADSPSWDRSGKYLYFLASTDLGLSSGFANTSSLGRSASYGAYLAVLDADEPTPFPHESDEEPVGSGKDESDEEGPEAPQAGGAPGGEPETPSVTIDFQGIDRRILALPLPVSSYRGIEAGPEGVAFIGEFDDDEPGAILHRFDLKEREAKEFATGVSATSVSADGKKILLRSGPGWRIVDTARPPGPGDGQLSVSLMIRIEPELEWTQIFDEVWRYERDYFYADNTHGADWDAVRRRYRPLVPFVRHRHDLNYILDQVGGELSVGHSFVFGGDMPETESSRVGLLGADLEADEGRWRIARIYTAESWNPRLDAPLDRPGLNVEEGHYVLAVDGQELTAAEDPFRLLDGTVDRQTILRINDRPDMEGSWTVTVVPTRSENALRQRAWVEDNRRRVDELSGGRLAYVWVPNTGGGGYVSFNRYYFAQQDRLGVVVDERFNGGGNLDDYMVDLMNRSLRGGITNEAPGQPPFRLPMAGVLGPKVLLINELAGSGGDYFPWAFRQLGIGPLIGTRTWGGLVASCVHYALLDGGAITSPCGAVYDENSEWVAENVGVPPDIEILQDARSVAGGGDPQLEAAVGEALRLLETQEVTLPLEPPFPVRARRPGGR